MTGVVAVSVKWWRKKRLDIGDNTNLDQFGRRTADEKRSIPIRNQKDAARRYAQPQPSYFYLNSARIFSALVFAIDSDWMPSCCCV
jgi:hypothetical protein